MKNCFEKDKKFYEYKKAMMWIILFAIIGIVFVPRLIAIISSFFRYIVAGGIFSISAFLVMIVIVVYIWRQFKLNKLKKDMGL
jgi:hypothetical protein